MKTNDSEMKDLFLKYESARKFGFWNMITDQDNVMLYMKLNPRHKSDREKYYKIIKNYDKNAKKWLPEDEFMMS